MSREEIQETELIPRILAGEKDLYSELVERHGVYLFRLCLALLGDRHQAEDAAQVALIKAYQSLNSFQGKSSFRTWIVRISLNHCKDILTKRSRWKFLSLDALLEGNHPVAEFMVTELEEAPPLPVLTESMLERLSEGERKAIRLIREKEGISYEEMGKELGLSLDGVKGRLKRARLKLRKFLKIGEKT